MIDGEIGYPAWGEAFFARIVTLERVLAGVNVLGGRPIEVGPLGVGPGRLVKVRARGAIGEATGVRHDGAPLRFAVALPVGLEFALDLGLDRQRFDAAIEVPLDITVRARDDLAIVLDVVAPAAAAVRVDVRPRGLRASLTGRAAGIEDELRRFVARFVAKELDSDAVRRATVIDVARAVDGAADRLSPGHDGPVAEQVATSLPRDLGDELDAAAGLLLDAGTPPRHADATDD